MTDDRFWEAEYKLQNKLRITLNVEGFTTEVETLQGVYEPVAEYVQALIQAERIKAKSEVLAETLYVISGIGSRGDKVNGNSKFMSGVMAAEDYIQIKLAELDTPKTEDTK